VPWHRPEYPRDIVGRPVKTSADEKPLPVPVQRIGKGDGFKEYKKDVRKRLSGVAFSPV